MLRMTDNPAEVNERVIEEWKADTSPGERVRTVVNRLGVKPRGLSVDFRSNCVMQ